MFEFKFPDVGEGITEGKLVRWLAKEGDIIKKEQSIAEVETDKAVVEIPSPISGKIMKLLYSEHDTIYVGKPLILIDDGQTAFQAPEQKIETKQVQQMPSAVANYEPSTANYSSIKNSMNTSLQNGLILALPSVRLFAKEHNVDLSNIKGNGPNGAILMKDVENISGTFQNTAQRPVSMNVYNNTPVKQDAKSKSYQGAATEQTSYQSKPYQSTSDVLASPSTRQLARDLGVNLSILKGTGNQGVITRDDVLSASKNASEAISGNISEKSTNSQVLIQPAQIQPISTQSIVDNRKFGTEEYIALTPIRKAISKKMTESWNNAVHVTVSDEVDVTDLVAIRDRNKNAYESKGIKLTYLPFFIKAIVLSLQKHPKLNATLDEQNGRIIQKYYYNMGIATDTEQGLLVPVMKNCESKNILQMAVDINDLATRARNRTIKLDEMQNGTFTVTSVGSIAGQVFTQIINYPEAAILGIGRIVEKPIVKNGGIYIRKMLTLSCTIDHRIIDGADASRFLKTLIEYLENPESMMMEMM